MEELILVCSSAMIMVLTQVSKRYFPVSPLWVALGLSLIGGLIYASLVQLGYWDVVRNFTTVLFGGAVTIYQVLKQTGLIPTE